MCVIVDIFVILGSIATMIIAYCTLRGLSTWKKQHNWKIKFEIATRLLNSIHKYQNAMHDLIGLLERINPVSSDEEKIGKYNRVSSLAQEIEFDISTSERLWDKKLRETFDEMREMENTIWKNIREKIDDQKNINDENLDEDSFARQHARKSTNKRRNDPMAQPEELKPKLDGLVKKAKDYLEAKRL